MQASSTQRTSGLVVVALLALGLGGCMGNRMTYGTGTTPGQQTIDDLTGLVALGGKTKPYVQYQPRPKVVPPPAVAALPKPGSDVEASNANWPRDPDELNRQRNLARVKQGTSLIPADNPEVEIVGLPKAGRGNLAAALVKPEDQAMLDRENSTKAEKIRAELKAADAGMDVNGTRARKTLTEPPTNYRVPDPNAPTEFKVIKKKFRWPWQKGDPNSAPEHLEQPSQ